MNRHRIIRRSLTALVLLANVILLTLPATTWAQEHLGLRYRGTTHGAVIMTGNTLGLSKAPGEQLPGTADSIGTFVCESLSTPPLSASSEWPEGTCASWQDNASSAVLDLPDDATVLYAELIWGGSFRYGDQDVEAHLDDPVLFRHEDGQGRSLHPDVAWIHWDEASPVDGFPIRYYVRSTDVTAQVGEWGAGRYTVGGVPATISSGIDTLNAAGWTLVVAYESQSEPARTLSVFTGGVWVDELRQGDDQVRVVSDRLCVPPYGTPEGEIAISAMEGDANLSGDTLSLRYQQRDAPLSGPNNPVENFFASQINNRWGVLDERGSMGHLNHDAALAQPRSGARQGWDITGFALDSDAGELPPGTRAIELEVETTDDSFVLLAAAFSVEAYSTRVVAEHFEPHVYLNDGPMVFRAQIANYGRAHAESPVLLMDLPPYFGDEVGVCVDGHCYDVATSILRSGYALAQAIPPAATRNIEIVAKHSRLPDAPFSADVPLYLSHYWSPCEGEYSELQIDELGSYKLHAAVINSSLSASSSTLRPGEEVEISAQVRNSGDSMHFGASMEWDLNPNFTFVPSSMVVYETTRGTRPVPSATAPPTEDFALRGDAEGRVTFAIAPREDTPAGEYALRWTLRPDQRGENEPHQHEVRFTVTRCDDGVVNGDEECDDGNAIDGDGCSASCRIEAPQCGDGSAGLNSQNCSSTDAAPSMKLSGGRHFGCTAAGGPTTNASAFGGGPPLLVFLAFLGLFRLRDGRSLSR